MYAPVIILALSFLFLMLPFAEVTLKNKDTTSSQPQKKRNSDVVTSHPFNLIETYSHNTDYFTQGLIWEDNALIENTGHYRKSKLVRMTLEGKVLQESSMDDKYFGEGICLFNGAIYQLTWRENVALLLNGTTFHHLKTFSYPPEMREGWGITHNNSHLFVSDGTDQIHILDPKNFKLLKSLNVTRKGEPVKYLNELEFVYGLIFANIWYQDVIVLIDPENGKIIAEVNFRSVKQSGGVLNGIAYDEEGDRFFITGKNWPKLFVVEMKEAKVHKNIPTAPEKEHSSKSNNENPSNSYSSILFFLSFALFATAIGYLVYRKKFASPERRRGRR